MSDGPIERANTRGDLRVSSQTFGPSTTRSPAEMDGSSPFFVVGVDRSGTTLLRVMLDRHPDLAIPPESHFIPRMWVRRRRYGRRGRIDDLEQFLDDLAGDSYFREWGLSVDAVRQELRHAARPDFAVVLDAIFRAYARTCGKPRWGDKTPDYIKHLPLLGLLFPSARFIHMVRDGRDVALSMLDLHRLHRHSATVGLIWARRVRRGRVEGERLGPSRYIEIRYEDLVREPEAELIRICAFLGSPFHPAMLKHDARAIKQVPASVRHMHARLALPPTEGLRDWRRDMQPLEVTEFEVIAGPELEAMGYERRTLRPGIKSRLTAWYHVARFAIAMLRRRVRSWVRQIYGR